MTIHPETIDRLIETLDNWPSNGKPERDGWVSLLITNGLVEEKTQMKNCKACGTQQVDWRYMKITPAGRLFMAAARRGQAS